MFSFCRLALVAAFAVAAAQLALAQDPSSSSSSSTATQAAEPQDQAQQTNQGSVSVQQRIRERRERRRAAAIKDLYTRLYEVNTGMGYLRFVPGPGLNGKPLQRVTMYAWDANVTRFYGERLGVTLDGRGYYGTAFVGDNTSTITRPSIATYAAMGGPTYRFFLEPRYALSGRVMAGYMQGNFSGDTSGFGGKALGLYGDGGTYAASASFLAEYNVSPNISLRLAPEYFLSGFGSTTQNSVGFTGGFVFRFGRQ
jgi:hypothetical protein